MFYDFYSKHIPREADFFVCALDNDLLPCNKFETMLMKKLMQKNPEVNIHERITVCLNSKRSGTVNRLANRDYNGCDVLFVVEPVPIFHKNPPSEEDCQQIHRLYKFILEKAQLAGAKHICLPLFGIREGLDAPIAFSIFVEHMEAFRKSEGGRTKIERVCAVVDKKKASKIIKKVIIRTRINLDAMRRVIRIFGAMTEPLYDNMEAKKYPRAEKTFEETMLAANFGELESQHSYGKDNLIDSLLFDN